MKPQNIVIGQRVDAAKVKHAKELRREMTPEETALWEHLRRNRLGGFHFRRQQVIDGFIIDFYCHAVGLVVEVDGEIHDDQQEYDAERDKVLTQRGIRILRIWNEEVRENLAGVLERIAGACKAQT